MHLYELSAQYQLIFDNLECYQTGEIDLESQEKLNSVCDEIKTKAIAIASHIKNIEATSKSMEEAIEHMKARKTSLDKRAESLTLYLQNNLLAAGINEINDSPYFKLKITKCPVSVAIIDESVIAKEYYKEKVSYTIDKIKIKESIEQGNIVEGAQLVNNLKLKIK